MKIVFKLSEVLFNLKFQVNSSFVHLGLILIGTKLLEEKILKKTLSNSFKKFPLRLSILL
jgi:hypothetical protein